MRGNKNTKDRWFYGMDCSDVPHLNYYKIYVYRFKCNPMIYANWSSKNEPNCYERKLCKLPIYITNKKSYKKETRSYTSTIDGITVDFKSIPNGALSSLPFRAFDTYEDAKNWYTKWWELEKKSEKFMEFAKSIL